MTMKKIGTYFGLGCVLAVVGMLFADICGSFFSGMEYGSACVLGMGMYLCVVIVTCTGIIISKRGDKPTDNNNDKSEE